MVYSLWLFSFSLLFLVAERLRPRERRPLLRQGIGTDLAYLVFNGEYLGILIGAAAAHLFGLLERFRGVSAFHQSLNRNVASELPVWQQFVILLLVFDFLQWAIHNLLHRVPWLWELHKVHHSIKEMDWIGNWRFHWAEVVVYRSLLYVPAAFFGFGLEAMFWYGTFNTLIGHFAHSNLRVRIGPLRYLLNHPDMHVWHHVHPAAGPVNRNFGIALSIWDWVFRTAFVPEGQTPGKLGFQGIEDYPRGIFGQALRPFHPVTAAGGQHTRSTSLPQES